MNLIALKEQFNKFAIFNKKDILKHDPNLTDIQLARWNAKGYLRRVSKGYYMFADREITTNTSLLIANKIYEPSYISLHTALALYSFIPETTINITSVTTKKTQTLTTEWGGYKYYSIKPGLFWGKNVLQTPEGDILIAEPEKAIADLFYLFPEYHNQDDFSSLRLNQQEIIAQVDLTKLKQYVNAFESHIILDRFHNFSQYLYS